MSSRYRRFSTLYGSSSFDTKPIGLSTSSTVVESRFFLRRLRRRRHWSCSSCSSCCWRCSSATVRRPRPGWRESRHIGHVNLLLSWRTLVAHHEARADFSLTAVARCSSSSTRPARPRQFVIRCTTSVSPTGTVATEVVRPLLSSVAATVTALLLLTVRRLRVRTIAVVVVVMVTTVRGLSTVRSTAGSRHESHRRRLTLLAAGWVSWTSDGRRVGNTLLCTCFFSLSFVKLVRSGVGRHAAKSGDTRERSARGSKRCQRTGRTDEEESVADPATATGGLALHSPSYASSGRE